MGEESMIERVATALENAADLEGYLLIDREVCARAAIEAMREPSEAMWKAAESSVSFGAWEDFYDNRHTIWKAMIEAALEHS